MSLLRLIARLDIKGPNVVKGVQMEGLRVVGKPEDLGRKYANEGADELLYIDTVATLYGRNQLESLLEKTCEEVFIPITVGGGIKSMVDIKRLFSAGADKVCINTAGIKSPNFIKDAASYYGSQAVVVSIEAKKTPTGWEAYTDNGREKTGKDAIRWAHEAVELGAGEILLTSVDKDGTRKGFDTALIKALGTLPVPVTVSGGMGSTEHALEALKAGADALAIGTLLHQGKISFQELRASVSRKTLREPN